MEVGGLTAPLWSLRPLKGPFPGAVGKHPPERSRIARPAAGEVLNCGQLIKALYVFHPSRCLPLLQRN